MTNEEEPPRLSVVAAIIDADTSGKGVLPPAARLGTQYRADAESRAAASATPTEQALAQVLQGGQGAQAQSEPVMAELLMLANQVPQADELATGLSQAFLPPDDSQRATERHQRRSAFADLYRRFALHQLNNQVRNKAAAILARLSRP